MKRFFMVLLVVAAVCSCMPEKSGIIQAILLKSFIINEEKQILESVKL